MLVSEAVGRTLCRLGGDVVFGLMGSGNLAVTNAIVAAGGRFFSSRHETGALCMADGYARVSGRLGVASVHQGPGLTNAVTAARQDPEKLCSSQATYDLIERDLFRRAGELRGSDQATFDKLDAMPTPRELLARGARWAPHRTYAALALWRIADTP